MATTAPQTQPMEESTDKGLKSGALGLVSSVVMGVASTAPAYSLAATLLFVVVLVRLQGPRGRHTGVHPDPVLLDRLQRDEQGGPGLRDHVHLGGAGVRPEDRLGWRVGHRGRRHPGHGQPGAGGRAVRVPARPGPQQRHRDQPGQRLGAARRGHLDHRDDLHLLSRHRGLGELPEGPAEHRARHAAGAVGDGTGQGVWREPSGDVEAPELRLAAAHSYNPFRLPRRDHPDAVHLLGLGHRRLGQRGDQGQEQDPGPSGDHLDRAAAGHLRDRDRLGAGVRRDRREGDRAEQRGPRRRRAVGARRRDLRHQRLRHRSCPGC